MNNFTIYIYITFHIEEKVQIQSWRRNALNVEIKMGTIENLQQIKSDYLKKCEKTILLFLFRHIFISREITFLLAPFLLSNYIYIYVYIHVYRRYIKKGMESKLNPITSVSSVDTACSGEFIFNGIRGDGKCRGLPSNEICPRERERVRKREGRGFRSSRRKFHYAVVEFFSGWGGFSLLIENLIRW